MAWNFTQGYLFGAAVSGGGFGDAMARSTARSGLPDWLTGGAFGPEASVPAFATCLALGVATLWLAWRAGRFSKPDSMTGQSQLPVTPDRHGPTSPPPP